MVAQREDAIRRYVQEKGLPFHILIDQKRAVTKRYGTWHRFGLTGWNIARPALFVIDGTGRIRSIYVGERQDEFPTSAEIDGALDDIGATRPAI